MWPLSGFFQKLIMICLGMDFFGFVLFEIHLTSYIYNFVSFAKFEKFSVIISLNILSVSLSRFCWNSSDINIEYLLLLHRSLRLSTHLFFILFFLPVIRIGYMLLMVLKFTDSIFCHPNLVFNQSSKFLLLLFLLFLISIIEFLNSMLSICFHWFFL